MNLDRVGPGDKAPAIVNVVIEIPANGPPVKYEMDKDTGAMFVDRFMNTAMYYPCNYGYVPHTLSDDGDPVDVLVVTPAPLISGSVISCRPVAMLKMTDEKGLDMKILAVPADKLCVSYRHYQSLKDIPGYLLDQISHFFAHYKDLEAGKWVKIDGWVDGESVGAEITNGIERYHVSRHKRRF